ncbi:hypothetical protein BB434_03520 [Helicobacter pylori]|uniref:hypothetical protein n=1 Tax=Helicobacter pylori TaxID=210 RepID=UPI0004D94080|nr:hypothetical protein [Helicobacter pylori]KEY38849.1 hypothetical protein GZ76_06870 [Helicobacter pylori]OOQ15449.1 hypothetical protein B0X47_00280 [Helicobacter pylori]OOQ20779.1 hypothetical protein B0X59_07225 [Helicobacter pylori]PDW49300.1 hypothetical protein BB434_03520 [Helicobacter pylori]PDX04226.1 hypothetical protein BB402_07875 [Helicobacter pylori]
MEKTRLLKLRALSLACLMGLGVSGCAFLDKQILNDHLTKAKNNPKYDCQKEMGSFPKKYNGIEQCLKAQEELIEPIITKKIDQYQCSDFTNEGLKDKCFKRNDDYLNALLTPIIQKQERRFSCSDFHNPELQEQCKDKTNAYEKQQYQQKRLINLAQLEAFEKEYAQYKPYIIPYFTKECVKNSPHLANKERLCQKEVHEKFHDPYSSSKELSVQSAISFCIKKVDAKLEKAALMNGVFINPYKKSTHCQRTHLDNKSLKEIALNMNPKLEKQSPFIDAEKIAMQSAGLLRKNKGVLIAFAADICMERNEHKKEEFISLKESCAQSQAKIYNNKERFDKFIQDYQKDLKTCLLDTSNTKEEMEQNVSQCQKEQLRDDNKGFTLEELVQKYAK